MLFLKAEVYLSQSGGQGDPGQGAPSVQPYLRLARAGRHSFLIQRKAFFDGRCARLSPCRPPQDADAVTSTATFSFLCAVCFLLGQVIGAGTFFFFFFYELIRPNGFHGCSNKAQKKT